MQAKSPPPKASPIKGILFLIIIALLAGGGYYAFQLISQRTARAQIEQFLADYAAAVEGIDLANVADFYLSATPDANLIPFAEQLGSVAGSVADSVLNFLGVRWTYDLEIVEINFMPGDRASVRVRMRASIAGISHESNDVLILRRVDDRWYIDRSAD